MTAPDPAVRDPARALSLAVKATEAHPECSTYWNTLGAVQYRAGDFKAAVTALDRATVLSQGGTAFDHFFLAMAHTRLENQEQAQHWFAQAMLWMEQHHAGHAELLRLCDEARSILFAVPETSDTARLTQFSVRSSLETAHRYQLVSCDGSDDRLPALAEQRSRAGPGHEGRGVRERVGGRCSRAAAAGHRGERVGLVGGPDGGLPQPGIHRGQQRRDPPGAGVGRPAGVRAALERRHDREGARAGYAGRVHGRPPEGRDRREHAPLAGGEIQASPFRFPGIATELDRGLRLGIVSKLLSPWATVLPKPKEACPVEWVSGASMILRRTMLEQIGLLDEGLYTYFDDTDICLRARRAGWETWYVPESQVIHLEGASTGVASRLVKPRRRPSYWYQARHRFFTKNYGALYAALADAAFISGYAIWRLRRRLQRKPDTDPPHMLIDSIRHSVFCAGPKVKVVENPALREAAAEPSRGLAQGSALAPEISGGVPASRRPEPADIRVSTPRLHTPR